VFGRKLEVEHFLCQHSVDMSSPVPSLGLWQLSLLSVARMENRVPRSPPEFRMKYA
jgi:hypothetical protein